MLVKFNNFFALLRDATVGRRLSIRLVFATLLYSICIAILVSAIQIYVSYQQSVQAATERFTQIETGYLPSLEAGLWEVGVPRIDALLDGMALLPDVGKIELIDEIGHLWTRNVSGHTQAFSSKDFALQYKEHDLRFALGHLHVELSNKMIWSRLKDRAIGISITASLTLLLGSLFVLILFQRWVTRHLQTMAEFALSLDLGNLDKTLQLNRGKNNKRMKTEDELDRVVNSINRMQARLKEDLVIQLKIEQELRLHQENLAQLVRQRTLDLEVKTTLLEAQNRELDAYARSVAHDLKNPITVLIGMSTVLNSSTIQLTPDQRKNSIAAVHKTATKMSSIIDALLLLASVRKMGDVKVSVLDMKKIASEACERLADLAKRNDVTLSFVGDWIEVIGHDQWIEEVWMNYLSNAMKYGGVPPIIELGAQKINEQCVKFWVADHGAGIPLARRSELFVEFSRLDPHVSEGHGLGLSIVQRIIHRLNGEVGYEDVDGGGSRFWFSLPIAR